MASSFDAYAEYVALKKHFTSDYDYLKYSGKLRLKVDTYEKRKDRYLFEKLAKKRDVQGYILANLTKNPRCWIRDILSPDGDKNYLEWKKNNQSLTYKFKNDINKLGDSLSDVIGTTGDHPELLTAYLSGDISLETLIIMLIEIAGLKKYYDNVLQNDPIWSDLSTLIANYAPFIKYDKETIRKIAYDRYKSRVFEAGCN
jgi:hypothetical protein